MIRQGPVRCEMAERKTDETVRDLLIHRSQLEGNIVECNLRNGYGE